MAMKKPAKIITKKLVVNENSKFMGSGVVKKPVVNENSKFMGSQIITKNPVVNENSKFMGSQDTLADTSGSNLADYKKNLNKKK